MKPELWRISRNDLIKKINDQGIGTSVHYKPIHMHYYYKNKYGYSDSDYPRAEKLSQNVISLPLYPALEDNNIDYIIDIINKIWDDFKY